MSVSAFPYGTNAIVVGPPEVNLDLQIDIFDVIDATVELDVFGDGDLERTALATVSVTDNWVDDSRKGGSYGNDFEVMLTATGGTNPTGPTLGVWHTIGSSQQWSWPGTVSFTGTLEIREIADTSNSDSAIISVTPSIPS